MTDDDGAAGCSRCATTSKRPTGAIDATGCASCSSVPATTDRCRGRGRSGRHRPGLDGDDRDAAPLQVRGDRAPAAPAFQNAPPR
jgi:hypothetical protein